MMIEAKRYLTSVLETDLSQDRLLCPIQLKEIHQEGGDIVFSVALVRKQILPNRLYFVEPDEATDLAMYFRLRFYNDGILRLLMTREPAAFIDESIMLDWDATLCVQPATLREEPDRWIITGPEGAFLEIKKARFEPVFSPDGQATLEFQGEDRFLSFLKDAFPALRLERGDGRKVTGFAFHILPGEHFCGTGERFERPDLFGQQIDLVNFDAAGVNNPRAYKNIPFLLSSRGYGLFVHSPSKMRLDVGAHSTRSLQWLVEDDQLDLFVIGGGSPARILENYRRLTGFPNMPPTWTFGVWMSRASYYTAAEVDEVARRMRAEGYPGDVLHLDVGWFRKEWMCDWQFSPENFPDPAGFIHRLGDQGFKVSLWQFPYVQTELDLAKTALANAYIGKETAASDRHWLGYTLDLTNPRAIAWYQSLLMPLLKMGAAAIKADFGEEVDEGAQYQGMDGARLHNLFALLYQKAVWEATETVHGAGNAVIWARSAWAGSQRYPVHWAGDAAGTYDALSGTIYGGLHFGLSGFAFWSHDVGGIHGIPEYMVTRPADDVYVRWTQVGVFSSHIRYHGGTPREPWEYPAVAGIVREWLRFRYALLPYILDQAQRCCQSGLPVFRSLVIDWPEDPTAWVVGDEYLFGDSFLVCPVLDQSGKRQVYLPRGKWVDFWSGKVLEGPMQLPEVVSPLSRLPLYVRYGSAIPFAEPVAHTGLLPQADRITVVFDEMYPGFAASPLKNWIHLD